LQKSLGRKRKTTLRWEGGYLWKKKPNLTGLNVMQKKLTRQKEKMAKKSNNDQ